MKANAVAAVCAAVVVVAVAGCTDGSRAVRTAPPAPRGVIAGFVDACTGVAAAQPRAATVRVMHAGATVAIAQVVAGDRTRKSFSVHVPPGRYSVEASNWPHVQRAVIVGAGSSARADFSNVCD